MKKIFACLLLLLCVFLVSPQVVSAQNTNDHEGQVPEAVDYVSLSRPQAIQVLTLEAQRLRVSADALISKWENGLVVFRQGNCSNGSGPSSNGMCGGGLTIIVLNGLRVE